MIRKLFSIILLATVAVSAMAQETIYLIKNNQVVAKYGADEVDCVSFTLPQGVSEDKLIITPGEQGKNSLTYSIRTTSAQEPYVHNYVLESTLSNLLLSYYGHDINEASREEIEALVKQLLYKGFISTGSHSFTFTDGASDGQGEFEVLAGQRYIIAAADLNDNADDLGEHVYYTTVQTKAPGKCAGNVSVSYVGLTEANGARFDVKATDDITRIYTLYGLKSNLDYFIQVYGIEYCMTTFAGYFKPEVLENDTDGWIVKDEGDYSIYVMGIDAEGNWTDVQSTTVYIKPAVAEIVGPKINILSKEKGNGSVKVNFEITPSNVDEAYVRLMSENDFDDRLNDGYTLAEIASGGDAIDITGDIRTMGEYTYTNNNLVEQWTSLVIMAKNADGCNVTCLNFFPEEGSGTEWEIIENKPANAPATAYAPAKKAAMAKSPMTTSQKAKAVRMDAFKADNTPAFRKMNR